VKKAGVAIEDWKLPIFKKHLDAAGYRYEEPASLTSGTLVLQVHYEWIHKLMPIIEAAQKECAEKKGVLNGRKEP
jgi:hypothetical protein